MDDKDDINPDMLSNISSVLFDLDGTLIDTAPDLSYALNILRDEYGLPPVDFNKFRKVVSLGGTAMVKTGFDIDTDDPKFQDIRSRFLEIYSNNICTLSRLFEGMDLVLNNLEVRNMNWGIVTNKPGWLTLPLLKKIGLDARVKCVVSGDTLPYTKPHPEPLLHACKVMNSLPGETIYIGDSQRDIEAGKNAGMSTMIAAYGYIEDNASLDEWGANSIIESPLEILDRLDINS